MVGRGTRQVPVSAWLLPFGDDWLSVFVVHSAPIPIRRVIAGNERDRGRSVRSTDSRMSEQRRTMSQVAG